MVDACSGNSGRDCIYSARLGQPVLSDCSPFAAKHDEHESAQYNNGSQSTDPQNVEYRGAISALPGIVVIAIQQQLVYDSANLPLRCLNNSQPELARGILYSVAVLRDVTVRGKQHDATGMRVLLRIRVPGITEAERLGQCVNLLLLAHQEVPTLVGAGAAVTFHISVFTLQRSLRRIARIKADGEHVEFAPDIKVPHAVQRSSQTR